MSVITYNSVELRDYTAASGGLWFHVIAGFDGAAEVRGEDVTIPGKAGRLATNRVADKRTIVLEGWVIPVNEANYLALVQTTLAVFDPSAAAAELRLYGPYLGIASGHYYKISARFLNALWDPSWEAGLPRKVTATFESVSSPPTWTYT